jgi:hypothetical protein
MGWRNAATAADLDRRWGDLNVHHLRRGGLRKGHSQNTAREGSM